MCVYYVYLFSSRKSENKSFWVNSLPGESCILSVVIRHISNFIFRFSLKIGKLVKQNVKLFENV